MELKLVLFKLFVGLPPRLKTSGICESTFLFQGVKFVKHPKILAFNTNGILKHSQIQCLWNSLSFKIAFHDLK